MIELIKEILFGVNNNDIHQAVLPALTAVAGLAQVLGGIDWGGKRRKALNRARETYNAQKEIYKGLDTSNPFADLTNPYKNLENTMEDLTVNKQQAQFQNQVFQQNQANTMAQLRSAAGSSGVAGLAQIMANQAQTQSQRIAASIGEQEAANRKLAAMQAAKLQEMEASGQFATDMAIMKGDLTSMQMEQSKQATLLGMDAQAVTGAQQVITAGKQMMGKGLGTIASAGLAKGGFFGGNSPSANTNTGEDDSNKKEDQTP